MTPEQKLKHAILIQACTGDDPALPEVTAANIDDVYDEMDTGEYKDVLQDARADVREGEVETGIKCDWSRHYESKAVAAKMPDGSWVGWTYWYGGGKHGEPEAVDWMDSAYDLDCKEEEKLVVIRTSTERK